MIETWLPVVGYEGLYSVSNQGRVRSEAREIAVTERKRTYTRRYVEKMLILGLDARGYPQVALCRDGTIAWKKVGAVVLEAFEGPRPAGHVMRHLNDVKTDNRRINLAWGTPIQDSQDALRNGRNPNANKTMCKSQHDFTPDNTYIRPSGKRECRQCMRDRDKARTPRKPKDLQLNIVSTSNN